MANTGYIGKISALVTASTADLERKLRGATGDVTRFGRSLSSTLAAASSSAERSLSGIFTPLQRLQRALDVGARSRLRLVDDAQVRRIQQIVSVSEQINKPLAQAARSFQGLSSDVGAAFLPALQRAQQATINLNNTVEQAGTVGERTFGSVRRVVDQTTQSIQNLAQAQSLLNQGLTGNELQFTSPRLAETLRAGAETTQAAGRLPADRLSNGDIARQVRSLRQYQETAVQAEAAVRALRLTPDVNPETLLAAERRLESLIETAARAQQQLARVVGRGSAEDNEIALLQRREQAGLQAEQQRQAQLRRAEDNEIALLQRREQAAMEIEKQRLARVQRAADDEVAIIIRREQAALEAEQRRIREAAVPLGDRLAEQGRRRVESLTGDVNIDSTPSGPNGFSAQAQRDIDALGSRVGAVRQQLEALPNSVRTRFVPELQRAQAQLVRLQNSPAVTARAIGRAARRVEELEVAARRAKDALQIPTSQDFLGNINTRRAVGELEALRGVLAQVGAQAGDRTSQAYDRLAAATRRAIESGTLGLPRVQEQLKVLQVEAAKAAAQTGKISVSRAVQQIQRGGDVASKSFQNVGLAANQLAFAIDDFFSVTGGVEQRIRAVGNNLTQLGFILGQTRGLFIALGAVLTAQAAIAFVRYINGGAAAEDQTKALNDALSRQKSLVEDLRRAFDSLGAAISRSAFSEPSQRAREFSRELDEISRKQRELRESRVADLDEGVQRERGIQNSLTRRLESETSAGARVALQRELRDSQRREREAAREAVRRRPTGDDVAAAVFEAELARTDFRSLPDQRRASQVADRVDRGADAAAIASQRAEIARQIEEIRGSRNLAVGLSVFGGRQDAVDSLAELQRLLNALELPFIEALDDLTLKISRSASAAASDIEAAQGDVADAIRRGVRGAGAFQAALDESARQLEEANEALQAASQIENPEEREIAVRRAEGRVRDVRLRQDAINEAAREIRLGRTFGGERTTAALSALEGNERFVNEQARLTARVAAAVDAELQARRNLESAVESGDQAAQALAREELEAAQAAADLAAAAAEAAISLEQAFARIRRTADNFLSASESIADDAQRRLDEFDPRQPGPQQDELTRDRDEAERQLIQDRRRNRELQNRLDRERAEAANDPRVQQIDARLEQLRSEREAAAERARIDGVSEDPAAAQARADEEARLLAERDEIIRQSTAGTQRLIDEENRLAAARRRAAEEIQRQREFEAEVAQRQDPQGDAIRGLDLLDSPGERAATELRQTLADIDAAFARQEEAILARVGGRPQDAREELDDLGRRRREAADRAFQDSLRQNAPAIFGLAASVQNAVLSGPSRAALQATDVSTVEGSRELNRLIRGDDAARNQDLVELQRQSQILERIAQGVENPAAIAD